MGEATIDSTGKPVGAASKKSSKNRSQSSIKKKSDKTKSHDKKKKKEKINTKNIINIFKNNVHYLF